MGDMSSEEIAAKIMSLESDSPERRARASMRLSGCELEEPMQETGPPPMPVTGDNWKITPLTDRQFDFVHETLTRERADKALMINEAVKGIPALEAAIPSDTSAQEIPVLTWASPKEMERLIDYAHRMREERDEARLFFGAIRGLAVKWGAGTERIEQTIRDAVALKKRINENLVDTPAVTGRERPGGLPPLQEYED